MINHDHADATLRVVVVEMSLLSKIVALSSSVHTGVSVSKCILLTQM